MKTKPILIAATIALLAGITLFIRCKTSTKTDAAEITQFLNKFNNSIKEGSTDTLMACFETNKKTKGLKRLVNLLAGKKDDRGSKPMAIISLDIDNAQIKNVNTELITVNIPTSFSHDSLNSKKSMLILKIYQFAPHRYKIVQADARKFYNDYVAYEYYVKSKTVTDNDVFDPMTIAAFKTADRLKARYDSVIWFEHIDKKTFYFVVKGRWNQAQVDSLDGKSYNTDYKMGVLNPDLKEIIPVEYDLIHNINGTIPGLIEVEKNKRKGLFAIDGKKGLPANYDEILPLNDDANLAVLRAGDDYFYLKKDYNVTEKIAGFNIANILNKINNYGNSYIVTDNHPENILEYNSREVSNSIIIPPSYLSEWNILPHLIDLRNPIRKAISYDDMEMGDAYYKVSFNEHKEENSWLESGFYSIVNDYLGSRGGLYQNNSVLMIDKKRNRIYGHQVNIFYAMSEGGIVLSGRCSNNYFKALNDSLFEYRTTAFLATEIGDNQEIREAPYYFYLELKDGKLKALPNDRFFGFTKYVKMDDSYLNGCYLLNDKTVDHMTTEMLQYAKNEVFAQYQYKFKNPKWIKLFDYRFGRDGEGKNTVVDDSLTEVDKYNINFLNQKIKSSKPTTLAAQ